jgi:hypothetical protein
MIWLRRMENYALKISSKITLEFEMSERVHRIIAFFFFLWYWGLNSRPSPWATPPALFLWSVFQDRVSQTIFLGWLWTMILLISVSWVARITDVSHWCPGQIIACWWETAYLRVVCQEIKVTQHIHHGEIFEIKIVRAITEKSQ